LPHYQDDVGDHETLYTPVGCTHAEIVDRLHALLHVDSQSATVLWLSYMYLAGVADTVVEWLKWLLVPTRILLVM